MILFNNDHLRNPLKKHIGQFTLCMAYYLAIAWGIYHYATCSLPETRFTLWLCTSLSLLMILLTYFFTKSDLKLRWDRWYYRQFKIGPTCPWLVYTLLVSLAANLLDVFIRLQLEIATLLAIMTGLLLYVTPYVFGKARYKAYAATVITAVLGCAAFVLLPTVYTIAGCTYIAISTVIALTALDDLPARDFRHSQLPRRYCILLSAAVLVVAFMGGACLYLWHHMDALVYVKQTIATISTDGLAQWTPWEWIMMALLTVSLVVATKWRLTVSGGPVGYAALSFIVVPMVLYVLANGLNLSILALPDFGLPMTGSSPFVTILQMFLLVGMHPHFWFGKENLHDDWLLFLYGSDAEIQAAEDEDI